MIDKTPIENKIPIKTKTSTRRKDTKKRVILDRNQVKENKTKGIKTPTININWNKYLWSRY